VEVLITIAYFFFVRLVFYDYKLLRFNFFWKMAVFGLYFAAVLTEIILLGQYTPYSKELVVSNYVIQIAPEIGGEVTEVHVRPNTPIKKGEPLITMDPRREKNNVDKLEAQLVAARQSVKQLSAALDAADAQVRVEEQNIVEAKADSEAADQAMEAAKAEEIFAKQKYDIELKDYEQGAGSKLRTENTKRGWDVAKANLASAVADRARARIVADSTAALDRAKAQQREAKAALESRINGVNTQVAQTEAELANARIALENRTILAPTDGYVVNLQIRTGQVVRLKQRMMTFVSTDEFRLFSKHRQKGIHWIRSGDEAEIAFEMYPGQVFSAEVVSVVWATPGAQGQIGGTIREPKLEAQETYWVRLRRKEGYPDYPMTFGAVGVAAVYTSRSADALRFLRKLEIQSESFLNYIYNPFK